MNNETAKNKANKTHQKFVTELASGDIIDPPAGEKVWIWRDGTKRRYKVVSVELGKKTKRGQHMKIFATCPSPYGDHDMETYCQMLSTKRVTVR